MEELIQNLIKIIESQNTGFDWASAVSALCSLISLIAIIVLLKERKEKQRPYLQVSFELIKSSLVCLIIKNVGETPAKLKELKFNSSFVNQLPDIAKERAKDRVMNISIYPKQQWVLCLDVITPQVLKYQNTQLEITFSYTAKGKRKKYKETETVDFNDYSGFLIYISETDELTQEVKKLGKSLEKVDRALNKLINNNPSRMQTQSYSHMADTFVSTMITGTDKPTILEKTGEITND